MTDADNGRVTIAILGNKMDTMLAAMLLTNAHVADMRVEQAAVRNEMAMLRQDLAVNQERWQNHLDLHKRERAFLGTLSAGLSTAAAAFAVWWNGQ